MISFLSLSDMIKLSYTCKRFYIILGDSKVLKRFQNYNSPTPSRKQMNKLKRSHSKSSTSTA